MSTADYLAPGTLCYLTRCADDLSLNGRAVTIESGPHYFPDEPATPYYCYTASWTAAGVATCAQRKCLVPIVPGADAEAEQRARSEVH